MADYILSHTAKKVDEAITEALRPRPLIADSDADSDIDITDEDGNVIIRCVAGHIKTKNFDSSTLMETIGDVESLLEALL